MASELFNAWENVMDPVKFRLYCAWHVDKAWRNNMNKVKNLEKRTVLYQRLKAIMHELDENKSNILLEDLITSFQTEDELKEYGEYFMSYHSQNTECWAYCFRKNCSINTNMSVERMHRTIKYLYFKGRKIGILDQSIHYVIKLLKHKLFDRLTNLCKGKVSHKLKILRKRHRQWKTFNVTAVESDAERFLITTEENMYHVEHNIANCNKCRLRCLLCNACIHEYTCTCPDFWACCVSIYN